MLSLFRRQSPAAAQPLSPAVSRLQVICARPEGPIDFAQMKDQVLQFKDQAIRAARTGSSSFVLLYPENPFERRDGAIERAEVLEHLRQIQGLLPTNPWTAVAFSIQELFYQSNLQTPIPAHTSYLVSSRQSISSHKLEPSQSDTQFALAFDVYQDAYDLNEEWYKGYRGQPRSAISTPDGVRLEHWIGCDVIDAPRQNHPKVLALVSANEHLHPGDTRRLAKKRGLVIVNAGFADPHPASASWPPGVRVSSRLRSSHPMTESLVLEMPASEAQEALPNSSLFFPGPAPSARLPAEFASARNQL